MSTSRALALSAVVDLVLGVALAANGIARDNDVLSLAGGVLLLTGAGVLAYVVVRSGRPDQL